MSRRLRRSMSVQQTRAQYTRVNDPLRMGIRTNTPDGWLNDRMHWTVSGPLGDVDPREECGPFAWDGSDGYGWVGPGSWAGMPAGMGHNPVLENAILPAVDRCTSVIVNPIIRADWRNLRATPVDDGVEERAMPLWITDPMLLGTVKGDQKSNTPMMERLSATDFWTTFLIHAMWYGRGMFICELGSDNQPLAGTLRLVNPFMVGYRDGEWLMGDPADPIVIPHDGLFDVDGQRIKLVVLRGKSPNDGIMSEGILQRHWQTFRLGVQIRSYIRDAYRTGNQPSGFLSVSTPAFTDQDAQGLRQSWMKAHGGSRRSVAVLNSTVAYTPIDTVSPVDAAVGDVQRASLHDVALAFNLDPIWVGQGSAGMNYNNQTDQRATVVDFTISTWGQKLMDTLSSVLPYGSRFTIDWTTFILPLTPADPGSERQNPADTANENPSSASDPEG